MRSVSSPRAVSMMIGTLRVSWRLAQAAADLDARQLRQHPVQQHQIGLFLGGDQQGFLAVARFQHAIAFALQIVAQQGDQGAFVFGDQDGGLCSCVAGLEGHGGFAGGVGLGPVGGEMAAATM